jgi:small GTP-binding protein
MYSTLYKYILIGDSGCGKSTLLASFIDNRFKENYDTTIGIEFGIKIVDVDNLRKIKLQIWDTAGQESYKCITRSYYRGVAVAFVVYDTTCRRSFENLPRWIEELKNVNGNNTFIVIIGNKNDMVRHREVSRLDGESFAISFNYLFYECSAKRCDIITDIFEDVTLQYYNKAKLDDPYRYRGVRPVRSKPMRFKCLDEVPSGCGIL